MELAGPSVEGLSPRFDCDKIPERKETIKKLPVSSEVENNPGKENTGLPTDDCSVNMMDKFKLHIQDTPPVSTNYLKHTPNRFILKKKLSTLKKSREFQEHNGKLWSLVTKEKGCS